MSGPKVVRIVSPQEYALLEARRDQLLAELRLAIERWENCRTEFAISSTGNKSELENRLNVLRQTFFPDFTKSVKRVQTEIQFLENDIKDMRIQNRAMQKTRRRQLVKTANAMIVELKRNGQHASAELLKIRDLAYSASESEVQEFQKMLNLSLSGMLKTLTTVKPDHEQSEFAKDLAAGLDKVEKIGHNSENHKADPKESRLDRLMSEIELMGNEIDCASFLNRLREVAKEPSSTRQELLTDSLLLDLSAYCKQQREQQNEISILTHAKDSLPTSGTHELLSMRAEIDLAITNPPGIKSAEALAEKARLLITQELSKTFAGEKRKAILKSLSELGYEVRDGMETAWIQNGKLVLASKGVPGTGVELGAGSGLERLQLRAVAISNNESPIDVNRGRSIETAWCADVDKLKSSLESAGHHFVIEQAQEVGRVPVKVCKQIAWVGESESDENGLESRPAQKLHQKEN